MRRLAILPLAAVLALSAGCTRDHPTAVQPVEENVVAPLSAAVPLTISSAAQADIGAAVDDAVSRLLPALRNPGVAEQLSRHLQILSESLTSGDRSGAERALRLTQRLLSREGRSPEAAADLDALQLLLSRAGTLLYGEGAAELASGVEMESR
jgi:hypothetical protein